MGLIYEFVFYKWTQKHRTSPHWYTAPIQLFLRMNGTAKYADLATCSLQLNDKESLGGESRWTVPRNITLLPTVKSLYTIDPLAAVASSSSLRWSSCFILNFIYGEQNGVRFRQGSLFWYIFLEFLFLVIFLTFGRVSYTISVSFGSVFGLSDCLDWHWVFYTKTKACKGLPDSDFWQWQWMDATDYADPRQVEKRRNNYGE